MSVHPHFQQIRNLKTANWAKKYHSQFHQKKFGCQPKNIFSTPGRNVQTYVGLAKDFKARYSKHISSMKYPSPDNSTTLSTHFLNQKTAGLDPKLSWRFLKTNLPSFNPITKKCILCINEKFFILYKPDEASLNSRSEIFSSCRHKKSELLVPPDPKSHGG